MSIWEDALEHDNCEDNTKLYREFKFCIIVYSFDVKYSYIITRIAEVFWSVLGLCLK